MGAAAAAEEAPRSAAELTRLIKGELAAAEVVAKINYVRVGEYLTALKALVPTRKWTAHLRGHLDLSLGRATRYMRYAADVRAYNEGRSKVKPTRMVPPSKHPEDQHHAKGYGAWRAQQQQAPRSRFDTEAARADKPLERELGLELIEAGFKLLAQKYHPDKGGDDRSFRCLTEVRARLRRCLMVG